MTTLQVELKDEVVALLRRSAARQNVTAERLAAERLEAFLEAAASEESRFEAAAREDLEKNRDLYRRLSACDT